MSGVTRNMLQSSFLLALVAVIGTSLLAGVNALTRERIAAQELRVVLESLNQVLPASKYDNALIVTNLRLVLDVAFRTRRGAGLLAGLFCLFVALCAQLVHNMFLF